MRRLFATFLLVSPLSSFAVETAGYSPDQNQLIWATRLKAKDVAYEAASRKCSWANAPKPDFMDEVQKADAHKNPALFLDLMTWLRYDQNARAVYEAFKDSSSHDKARVVDVENLARIRPIILGNFPSLQSVGYEGSNAALVLSIHADSDPAFQKEAFSKVEDAARRGDIPDNFPVIFKTVRSKVVGDAALKARDPQTPKTRPEAREDCFHREYYEHFNEYVRAHLPSSVRS